MCAVHSKSKEYNDIAFYDGEFEEVYEQLMNHFLSIWRTDCSVYCRYEILFPKIDSNIDFGE